MTRPSKWLILIAVSIPTLALVGGGALWLHRAPVSSSAVSGWVAELTALDEDRASNQLRQAASRDVRGLPVLIAGLATKREPLVMLAKRKLIESLNSWELLDAQQAEQNRVSLAELLAAHMDQFDIGGQRVATDLASRMLANPTPGESQEPTRLLTACEQILRVVGATSGAVVRSNEPESTRAPNTIPLNVTRLETALEQPRSATMISVPRELSLPPLPQVTTPPVREASPSIIAPANEPSAARTIEQPQTSPTVPDLQPVPPSPRAKVALPRERLGDASLIELLIAWHDATVKERPILQHEFNHRGISPRQLEVGLGVTSPDAATRRQWVEQLPKQAGIDAKPWLLLLSRDEDATVRLATLQVISTAGDLELRRRVSEMSMGDESSEVRELAGRIGQGPNTTTRR